MTAERGATRQLSETCGHELANGVLDRGGHELWCPTCAKEYIKQAQTEWEYNNRKWKESGHG